MIRRQTILLIVLLIVGCANNTQSTKKEILKWRDNDKYTEAIHSFVINGSHVSIKIKWKSGSRRNYSGTIKKIPKGRKVTYANEHDDYYIIYNKGTLGICDVLECFKTLNPIK